MNSILLSLLIGIVAGFLDIIPMIVKKLPWAAIASAFLQYLFVAVIIVHVDLPGIAWWLEGGLVALMMAIPVVVIVAGNERKAVPIILVNAVVLGSLIGMTGHWLMNCG